MAFIRRDLAVIPPELPPRTYTPMGKNTAPEFKPKVDVRHDNHNIGSSLGSSIHVSSSKSSRLSVHRESISPNRVNYPPVGFFPYEEERIKREVQEQIDFGRPLNIKRPRTVFCYICGREYGTASIGIHEKQCIVKWKRENSELPKHMQKPEPVRPGSAIISPADKAYRNSKPDAVMVMSIKASGAYNIDQYNEAALMSAAGQLIKCQKCNRKFASDRIQKHESVCVGQKVNDINSKVPHLAYGILNSAPEPPKSHGKGSKKKKGK